MKKKTKYLLLLIAFISIILFSINLFLLQLKNTVFSAKYIERVTKEERICEIFSFNYDYFSNYIISGFDQPFISSENIQNSLFLSFPADFIKKEINKNSLIMENYIYGRSTELPLIDLRENKKTFNKHLIESSQHQNKEIVEFISNEITQIIPDTIELSTHTIYVINKNKHLFSITNLLFYLSIPILLLLIFWFSLLVSKKTNILFSTIVGYSYIFLAFWSLILTFAINKIIDLFSTIIVSPLNIPSFALNGIILPIFKHINLTIISITLPIFGALLIIGLFFVIYPIIKKRNSNVPLKTIKPFKRKHKIFEGYY